MANAELVKVLKQGSARWNEYRVDLPDEPVLDFTEANLWGAQLSGTDLNRADLCRAHLAGTDLRGANLRQAHLVGAHLRGAHLSGADQSQHQIDTEGFQYRDCIFTHID